MDYRSDEAMSTAENCWNRLNADEQQIAWMVGCGCRDAEISQSLAISKGVVRERMRSVFEKLEVTDRLELILYIAQSGRHPSYSA